VPIDPRILRVGVTINDELRIFENLAIIAQGSKFASATQNETVIKIANLDKETRDFLATEGTPFNRIRQSKRQKVFIEAGRESTGSARVFLGDITLVTIAQPPDIWTTIKAVTSQYQKGDIISTNEGALSTLSTISKKTADTLGLSHQFEASDKQISNYGYTGSATKQVDKIAELGDIDVYVDDDKLVVKNKNAPIKGDVRIISANTGMIGMPEFTDFGVKVRFLFDIHSKVGQKIEIKSDFYPAANGVYNIFKLNFDLSNRDTPFYYVAETIRQGGSI
jgi:hypothetical protein